MVRLDTGHRNLRLSFHMETHRESAQPCRPTCGSSPADQPAQLLSIGLAVYNGALYLSEALDSLLAQDVGDLELVISDNASTDDTPSICAAYAERDARVRYTRNGTNIGAVANFNRVFELSCGKYFMWGSDDDVWDARFARLCIERLEQSPRAVMCGSGVANMTHDGVALPERTEDGLDTEGMDVAARVRKMTSRLTGSDVYAVIRPEALMATALFRRSICPDTLLVLELLLLGESLCIPEVLLRKRLPPVPKTARTYMEEIDPGRPSSTTSEEVVEPLTYMAREVLATIRSLGLDPSVVAEVESDLVDTLSFKNLFWRQLIMDEQGLRIADLQTLGAIKATIRTVLRLPADTSTAAGDSIPLAPWRARPEMRMAWLRRALLRILQPFIDGQNQADAECVYILSRLSGEVDRLERRVHDLEREKRA